MSRVAKGGHVMRFTLSHVGSFFQSINSACMKPMRRLSVSAFLDCHYGVTVIHHHLNRIGAGKCMRVRRSPIDWKEWCKYPGPRRSPDKTPMVSLSLVGVCQT